MATTIESKVFSYVFGEQLKRVSRLMTKVCLLFTALFIVWSGVMFLVDWYSPVFHVFATFSSAFMVGTGKSWGVIGKVVE